MKPALLAAFLLVSVCLFAQQGEVMFQSVAQPQAQPTTGQSQQYVPPQMLKAPTPGHPLDPNDVAILTGKADREERPAYQGTYYANPYTMQQFGSQIFTRTDGDFHGGRFNGFSFQNGGLLFGGRLFGPHRPFSGRW